MSETIIFFGSGPVAAKSLELLAADFEIEAVITKPKPEHHRGDFPVIELAEKLGLKLVLTKDSKELNAVFETASFKSQVAILIDFGIIISSKVIDYFPLGIINSHFSILPELRGADPITFAILSGQQQTGVSIMRLVPKMDEGPLLAYGEYDLPADITTPLLTEHLINFSHQLLVDIIPQYVSGEIKPVPQDVTKRKVSYSRKLSKDDGVTDWSKPAEVIEREVRAFIEWPKSRTRLAGKDVIITKAYAVPAEAPDSKPGDLDVVSQIDALGVCTGSGTLRIQKIKPAGKKEMSAGEFIRGYLKS